jgi:hypothetical protein
MGYIYFWQALGRGDVMNCHKYLWVVEQNLAKEGWPDCWYILGESSGPRYTDGFHLCIFETKREAIDCARNCENKTRIIKFVRVTK